MHIGVELAVFRISIEPLNWTVHSLLKWPIKPSNEFVERIVFRIVVDPAGSEILFDTTHRFPIHAPTRTISGFEHDITFISVFLKVASSSDTCSPSTHNNDVKVVLKRVKRL